MRTYHSASGSSAEDLFIELFSDTFAPKRPAISTPNTPSLTSTRTVGLPTSD
mgnify:CR=1 FL=1